MYPIQIRPESGIRRAELQAWLAERGIDTRMVWTGNAARQPAFRDKPMRIDRGGLANADRVMETGLILPMGHALEDREMEYIGGQIDAFLERRAG